jgi:hypothetical protein
LYILDGSNAGTPVPVIGNLVKIAVLVELIELDLALSAIVGFGAPAVNP